MKASITLSTKEQAKNDLEVKRLYLDSIISEAELFRQSAGNNFRLYSPKELTEIVSQMKEDVRDIAKKLCDNSCPVLLPYFHNIESELTRKELQELNERDKKAIYTTLLSKYIDDWADEQYYLYEDIKRAVEHLKSAEEKYVKVMGFDLEFENNQPLFKDFSTKSNRKTYSLDDLVTDARNYLDATKDKSFFSELDDLHQNQKDSIAEFYQEKL